MNGAWADFGSVNPILNPKRGLLLVMVSAWRGHFEHGARSAGGFASAIRKVASFANGWLGSAACIGLGLAALGLVSCGTLQGPVAPPPMIEGASFVGNKVCFDCHTNYVRSFASSPHARLHYSGEGMPGRAGCESCHGPGSKHVSVGGGLGQFIVNPGRDPAACFQCHLQAHAEFQLPQHHPLPEGKMNCVQCHDPHGRDIFKPARGLAMARINQACAQCHAEQSKPVVYEHEALREGCLTCHQPHGSVNAKMLVQADNNLCLKCHAQVATPSVPGQPVFGNVMHGPRVLQGRCWSAGCHTGVHGSNIDPRLRY